MAIIKCPECGHQVSDKAPTCPSCGVEIAGHITRCKYCGEVYLSEYTVCPNCHDSQKEREWNEETEKREERKKESLDKREGNITLLTSPVNTHAEEESERIEESSKETKTKGKRDYSALIVSFVLALIICGCCLYFYSNAKTEKESSAYEYAMKSKELAVLDSYLKTYIDAPKNHREDIENRIKELKSIDQDWINALVSNSKANFRRYADTHPDSKHKEEALQKIDSIDWAAAQKNNTIDGMREYLADHEKGLHADEANERIKKLNALIVTPEEQTMIAGLFRKFFQSVNSKNGEALSLYVTPTMTSLIGQPNATKADVQAFMEKQYKENVSNLNWHILGDYKIEKREIADEKYEYTVGFSATKVEEHKDNSKAEGKYSISGVVSPDRKISQLNMTKLTAPEQPKPQTQQ